MVDRLHPGRLVALRGGHELRHDSFRLLQTRRILDDRRERLLDPAGEDGGPAGGSEVALGPELLPLLLRDEGPHRQERVHHRQRGLPAVVPEEADGELAFADGGGLAEKSRPDVRLGRLHDVEGRLPLRVVLPSGLHDLPGALRLLHDGCDLLFPVAGKAALGDGERRTPDREERDGKERLRSHPSSIPESGVRS